MPAKKKAAKSSKATSSAKTPFFAELTNFKYKRTGMQAFGFYLAYLFFLMLTAFVIGMVIGIVTGQSDPDAAFQLGQRIGTVFGVVAVSTLGILVMSAKNLFSNFGYLLLLLLAAGLTALGGGILGLIPVAYMTTRKAM